MFISTWGILVLKRWSTLDCALHHLRAERGLESNARVLIIVGKEIHGLIVSTVSITHPALSLRLHSIRRSRHKRLGTFCVWYVWHLAS